MRWRIRACAKPKSARSPRKRRAAAKAAKWSTRPSAKPPMRASARRKSATSTTRRPSARPAKSPRSVWARMKSGSRVRAAWRSKPKTMTGRQSRAVPAARLWRPVIVFGFERHAARTRLPDFILAQTLLGDFAGLALGLLVVLVALFLLALARIGGFALGLVDHFAALAAASLFLGDLALFGFAHARIRQRMGARDALLVGQRAQHHAGWLRRLGGHRRRRGFGLGGRLPCGLDGCRLGLDLGRSADAAAFDLLDHDLLAAAVTEALAHHARLVARLERQLGDAQFLFARGLCVAHSEFCPRAPSVGACALTKSGEFPVRKRSKRSTRARKVSLTGPASRAACTTFGRFNAKSNCALENISTIAISRDFSGVLRCNAASSLRFPPAAASGSPPPAPRSTTRSSATCLAKPPTTWPALPAIASASSGCWSAARSMRSSSRSVVVSRSAATRTLRL